MEYMYVVANQQNNGGWRVSFIGTGIDESETSQAQIENRLPTVLNALAAKGWRVVSSVADHQMLTIILAKE